MRKLPRINAKWDPAAITLSVLACVAGLFSIWAALAGAVVDDSSSLAPTPLASVSPASTLDAQGGGDLARRANLASAKQAGGLIAIVIDDLGSDPAATRRAMRLPGGVTLAFLPFPAATPALAAEAARGGHELIVHVPMQADNGAYPGMEALETVLTPSEITLRLAGALDRVPSAIGINNHMGSRFTADLTALAPVMAVLKARQLFFFDSRTTPATRVAQAAALAGVPTAGRDVFLDDIRTELAVRAQLLETEKLARQNGVAIAIGHPHAVTLAILESWTKANGTRLIALSDAMRLKARQLQAER